MKHIVHIVTGAPGSGKSTAVEAFLRLKSQYLAFDIDWLIAAASELAGRDVHVHQSTWKPYGALWFDVLYAVYKNNRTPVLFAPTDTRDIERHGLPAWCQAVEWLLLDCDDATRQARLKQRPGWTDAQVEEAIEDASFLRQSTRLRIDTGRRAPDQVARDILAWLDQAR